MSVASLASDAPRQRVINAVGRFVRGTCGRTETASGGGGARDNEEVRDEGARRRSAAAQRSATLGADADEAAKSTSTWYAQTTRP